MSTVLRSFIYALISPFIFVAVGEAFSRGGKNSWQEGVAGAIVMGLYLGISQFILIRKGRRNLQQAWPPILAAAIVPVLAFLLVAVLEKPSTLLWQGVPILSGGLLGVAFGAMLALRQSRVRNAAS